MLGSSRALMPMVTPRSAHSTAAPRGFANSISLYPRTSEIKYSLLSAYGIQLNPTCRESIILSLENDGGFLYPLIDK
jgi:hypothetical protein